MKRFSKALAALAALLLVTTDAQAQSGSFCGSLNQLIQASATNDWSAVTRKGEAVVVPAGLSACVAYDFEYNCTTPPLGKDLPSRHDSLSSEITRCLGKQPSVRRNLLGLWHTPSGVQVSLVRKYDDPTKPSLSVQQSPDGL